MIRVSRDGTTDFVGEPQSDWVRGRVWGIETLPLASPWSPSVLFLPEGSSCSYIAALESCCSLV